MEKKKKKKKKKKRRRKEKHLFNNSCSIFEEISNFGFFEIWANISSLWASILFQIRREFDVALE